MWFSRSVSSAFGPLGGSSWRQTGHMSSSRILCRAGRGAVVLDDGAGCDGRDATPDEKLGGGMP